MDSTNMTNHTTELHISAYYTTELLSCVLLLTLCIFTVTGNGILLLATWIDPFKNLKNTSSYLVLSLGFANLLTGLLLEPLLVYAKFMIYFKRVKLLKERESFDQVNDRLGITLGVSSVTMNASFLTVLALTYCQVLAIASPHKYKTEITNTKSFICVVCIWFYAVFFSLLPTIGVKRALAFELDLHINTTSVIVALVLGYVALYRAYRRYLQTQSRRGSGTRETRRKYQKHFTALNLSLAAFVVVFSVPVATVNHLKIYWLPSHPEYYYHVFIAGIIANDFLLIKFALDPIAYALRLRKYRRAFRSIIRCSSGGVLQVSDMGPQVSSRCPTNVLDKRNDHNSNNTSIALGAPVASSYEL